MVRTHLPPLASIAIRPAPPAPAYRLRLMGGFTLQRFSEPVPLPAGAQRLLAYLALQGRPALRQRVAGTFWPESSDDRAMGNLRSQLWRLNGPSLRVVASSGDRIGLAADVAVDAHAIAAFARSVLDATDEADGSQIEELSSAGELLPDWSDDWVIVEREHLRQLRLHALERLSGRLVEAGRYGRAVEVCLVAVSAEPLRESAHRELMRAHLAEGNVVEAVRQYETYRVLLLDELGLEPSPAMTDLLRDSGLAMPIRLNGARRDDRAGSRQDAMAEERGMRVGEREATTGRPDRSYARGASRS